MDRETAKYMSRYVTLVTIFLLISSAGAVNSWGRNVDSTPVLIERLKSMVSF